MKSLRRMLLVAAIALGACAAHMEAQSEPLDVASDTARAASGPPASRHVLSTRAATIQAANMTRTAADLDRPSGRVVLSAFVIPGTGENGPAGSAQPGVGLWDERTERVIADQQINLPPDGTFTTATSNVDHDAASIVPTADDGVIVPYGALSTYHGNAPPQAWACLRAQFCEPFKFAPSDSQSSQLATLLAKSPEYLLPSSGLSEMTSASLGDATLLAGQQQVQAGSGQAGAQGLLSYRRGGRFDTSAGSWSFRENRTPPGDGLYTITRTPNDGAYIEFAVTSAASAGSISLDIGGVSCSMRSVPAGDPAGAVTAFAQYASAQCPSFRSRYEVIAAKYAPLERSVGGAAVGIALRSGDLWSLPAAKSVQLNCSGGITCASSAGADQVVDVRTSGLHRHYLFGGVYRLGRYVYDVIDVQQVTGSWYGAEHNSYALALACFRTSGPEGSSWPWTDCSGKHPFTLRPGDAPVSRLDPGSPYLLGAPPSYPGQYAHYVFDFSMRAQPPAVDVPYPVVSSESVAQLRDGSLIVAHACQTQTHALAICYLQYDARTGRTTRVGFVDAPDAGGSLASIALRTDGQGTLALGALVGMAAKWGCGSSGGCALVYRFNDRTGSWSRVSSQPLGGTNDAGFAGTVQPSGHGFLYAYKELETGSARIVSFERPAP